MANKYIDNKYISTFNLDTLKRNVTILGNAKNEVLKGLVRALNQRNIKKAIECSLELHISGYFDNVFAKLTNHFFNDINLAQPKGIIYLEQFTKYYNDKYTYTFKKNHPLSIINDIRTRNFLCFFITLCCLSNQKKLPKLNKISDDDFDLKKKKRKLISKNLSLVQPYINKEDPKEIIIPLSEICNLLHNKNIVDREQLIIYWLSWLYEYEKKYHTNGLLVKFRHISGIDSKYCRDFIWIVWDILINACQREFKHLILSLYSLFKIKFTKTSKKTKSYLIVNAIYLCVNPVPKIKSPVVLNTDVLKRCNLESLKSNLYYNEMLTKIALT